MPDSPMTSPMTSPQSADEGYATAFYEIAAMLGIPVRADSPANIWVKEMRPMLAAHLNARVQVTAVAPGVEGLRAALATAAARFAEYAEMHSEKLWDGSISEAQRNTVRAKVDRNLRYAAEARAALSPTPSSDTTDGGTK